MGQFDLFVRVRPGEQFRDEVGLFGLEPDEFADGVIPIDLRLHPDR
jgi:hypothetical protein